MGGSNKFTIPIHVNIPVFRMFANLSPEDKEAFFALLDEYESRSLDPIYDRLIRLVPSDTLSLVLISSLGAAQTWRPWRHLRLPRSSELWQITPKLQRAWLVQEPGI